MHLIIDIGNTVYKFYVFNNEEITDIYKLSDSAAAANLIINEISKNHSISRCIVSSVRLSEDPVHCLVRSKFPTLDFSRDLKLPVKISYKTPESLGNDRIAAVCGAVKIFPGHNIFIIDAGTAITYDLVEAGKIYSGGNISPGINIRFKALHTFTGKLPLLNIDKNIRDLLGTSTNDAIISGVQKGILYEFTGYIKDLKHKYKDLKIILTGGDSFFFENSFKSDIFVVENLTAIGLKNILDLNV